MGASVADIRAGRGNVEIGADTAPLDSGLKGASAKLGAFVDSLQMLGAALAFKGVTESITGWVRAFADGGRELYMLNQTTGASVEQLDELKAAAKESGVGFDEVADGVRHMEKYLSELRISGSQSNDVMAALGLTLGDFRDLSPVDAFEKFAEAIAAVGDASVRTGTAMAIMGRGGANLMPVFRGLGAARERARAGGVTSGVEAVRALELSMAFKKLSSAIESVGEAIGSALSPAFKPVLDKMTEIVTGVKDWVKANQTAVQGIGVMIGVSASLAAVVAGVASAAQIGAFAWSGLGKAVAGVKLVFTAIGGVIAGMVSPLGLTVGAIVGVGAYLLSTSETGKRAWNSLSETFNSTWSGMTDALNANQLGLAWDIAMAGMKVSWFGFANWWTSTFPALSEAFKGFADTIAEHFTAASRVLVWAWLATTEGIEAAREFARHETHVDRVRVERPDLFPSPQADLDALLARARQLREAEDERLRGRLSGPGSGDLQRAAGARGTFNSAAAFGLVGADSPIVQRLRELTSVEREALRTQQRIAEEIQGLQPLAFE